MTSIHDILEARMDEVKPVPQLPPGNYIAAVFREGEFETVPSEKGTFMKLTLLYRIQRAYDPDEMQYALQAYEEAGGVLSSAVVRFAVMFNMGDDPESKLRYQQTMNQLKKVFEVYGFDPSAKMAANLKQIVNTPIGINVTHKPNKNNPDDPYIEVGRIFDPNV